MCRERRGELSEKEYSEFLAKGVEMSGMGSRLRFRHIPAGKVNQKSTVSCCFFRFKEGHAHLRVFLAYELMIRTGDCSFPDAAFGDGRRGIPGTWSGQKKK